MRLRHKNIELDQLRAFSVTVSHRNFSVAARKLGVSVSTIWQQVRALERTFQTTLLRRRGTGLQVTREGHLLLELIRPHLNGLEAIPECLRARGRLVVATCDSLASEQVAPWLQARAVEFELRVLPWREIAPFVERGQADLGIVPQPDGLRRSPGQVYEEMARLRFGVLAARTRALPVRLSLEELIAQPLILPPRGTCAREMLDGLLERAHLLDELDVVLDSPTTDVMFKYVELGLGVAPAYVTQPCALPGVALHQLQVDVPEVAVCLVARPSPTPRPINPARLVTNSGCAENTASPRASSGLMLKSRQRQSPSPTGWARRKR